MRLLLISPDVQTVHYLRAALPPFYILDSIPDTYTLFQLRKPLPYEVIFFTDVLESPTVRKRYKCPMILLTRTMDVVQLEELEHSNISFLLFPASPSALARQLQALGAHHSNTLQYKELRLDEEAHLVYARNVYFELTPTEFSLLRLFLYHPRQILSKKRLVQEIWMDWWNAQPQTLETHIHNLRKKLSSHQTQQIIRTIYGKGYRLE